VELEEPQSAHWQSPATLRAWGQVNRVPTRDPHGPGPIACWAAGIDGWLCHHHPDPQWAARPDFGWLRSTLLGKFYTAAHRASRYESLGLDEAAQRAVEFFLRDTSYERSHQ